MCGGSRCQLDPSLGSAAAHHPAEAGSSRLRPVPFSLSNPSPRIATHHLPLSFMRVSVSKCEVCEWRSGGRLHGHGVTFLSISTATKGTITHGRKPSLGANNNSLLSRPRTIVAASLCFLYDQDRSVVASVYASVKHRKRAGSRVQ